MSQATPTPSSSPKFDSQSEFEVFLAHNSEDKTAVEEIARQLKNLKLGIKPWWDINEIRPGEPFPDAIQKAIQNVKAGVIFIGKKGLGD